MPNETAFDEEQAKKALIIKVLDRGFLGLREAGVLASLLAEGAYRDRCKCDAVCDGCVGKCASGCVEA